MNPNLNSSNHYTTMINNTHGDISPKNRNFPKRIKSASNAKINYDKEKLYDENLHLKEDLKKMKGEMEFYKKENLNLETEMSKKDKNLEELMIETQNSLLSNFNNITDGGPINKTILGRITEVNYFIFFKILNYKIFRLI